MAFEGSSGSESQVGADRPRRELSAADEEGFGPPDVEVTVKARVAAPIWAVWRAYDTDHLTVLGRDTRRFEDRPRADGGIERTGARTGLKGLGTRWEEHTHDFVAPEWVFIDRRHTRGPLARETWRQSLWPAGDGVTGVAITSCFWAKNRAWAPLVKGLRGGVRRSLERAYSELRAQLEAPDDAAPGAAPAGAAPPPLTRRAAGRVRAAASRLSSPDVAENLAALLERAPLLVQDRIEPRALARAWGLPEEEVIVGCLEAVREGALALWWELLCPSCDGARESWQTLDDAGREAHCPSCNIRFDADFPGAVAVAFRPSPAVRSFRYEPQCIGSPAHTPHVLARARLEPGELRALAIDLGPGRYRIRDIRSLEAVSLEVAEGAETAAVTAELAEGRASPPLARVRPGRCEIALRSRLAVPTWVVLEERSRPPDTLTAAEILGRRRTRELLPDGALAPSARVHVYRGALVMAELFGVGDEGRERACEALRVADARAEIAARGRHVVGVYDDLASALRAARELRAFPEACAAVARGPLTRAGGSAAPGGEAMQEALSALRVGVPGFIALPGALADDEEVCAALAEPARAGRLVPGPALGGRQDYLVAFGEGGAEERFDDALGAPGAAGRPLEGALVLGRYRIGAAIGAGGVGAIHAALDEGTGAEVVVKVFRPFLARRPAALQQCLNEARICSLLDHPHVVTFLDFGHAPDGRPAIVMERVRGVDLRARIAQGGPLDPTEVCRVGREVAAGLEAVHAAGVIHRDVKPANVLLASEPSPRAVLVDFGVALDRDAGTRADADGSGTPLYASPEQRRRERATPKSDLYALGLTLYEALTGEPPPSGEREEPPDVRARASAPVPRGLAEVIRTALVADPSARLATAADARALLEDAARAADEGLPRASMSRRTPTSTSRPPWTKA